MFPFLPSFSFTVSGVGYNPLTIHNTTTHSLQTKQIWIHIHSTTYEIILRKVTSFGWLSGQAIWKYRLQMETDNMWWCLGFFAALPLCRLFISVCWFIFGTLRYFDLIKCKYLVEIMDWLMFFQYSTPLECCGVFFIRREPQFNCGISLQCLCLHSCWKYFTDERKWSIDWGRKLLTVHTFLEVVFFNELF